jgi:hypothetical protein
MYAAKPISIPSIVQKRADPGMIKAAIRGNAESWRKQRTGQEGKVMVSPATEMDHPAREATLQESAVDLGAGSNQKKYENQWSEWQDLNLRPLRPERGNPFVGH